MHLLNFINITCDKKVGFYNKRRDAQLNDYLGGYAKKVEEQWKKQLDGSFGIGRDKKTNNNLNL